MPSATHILWSKGQPLRERVIFVCVSTRNPRAGTTNDAVKKKHKRSEKPNWVEETNKQSFHAFIYMKKQFKVLVMALSFS